MKKLAIIGCGNIARFHIPAMQSSGFIIAAISGRPNSIDYLEGFASELKLNKTKIYLIVLNIKIYIQILHIYQKDVQVLILQVLLKQHTHYQTDLKFLILMLCLI